MYPLWPILEPVTFDIAIVEGIVRYNNALSLFFMIIRLMYVIY